MLKRFWNWIFTVNDRKNIKKKDDSNTSLFYSSKVYTHEKDFKTSKKDASVDISNWMLTDVYVVQLTLIITNITFISRQ